MPSGRVGLATRRSHDGALDERSVEVHRSSRSSTRRGTGATESVGSLVARFWSGSGNAYPRPLSESGSFQDFVGLLSARRQEP